MRVGQDLMVCPHEIVDALCCCHFFLGFRVSLPEHILKLKISETTLADKHIPEGSWNSPTGEFKLDYPGEELFLFLSFRSLKYCSIHGDVPEHGT